MQFQRKYGVGGLIGFTEYEIEIMYYTCRWFEGVLIDEKAKQACKEMADKLESEVNTGVFH